MADRRTLKEERACVPGDAVHHSQDGMGQERGHIVSTVRKQRGRLAQGMVLPLLRWIFPLLFT